MRKSPVTNRCHSASTTGYKPVPQRRWKSIGVAATTTGPVNELTRPRTTYES